MPLGASKPVDFIINGDETGCAGCHAVSRDGKQVAVEFGSGDTTVGSGVVDGAMPRMRNFRLTPSIRWTFSWFNPSGDKLLTNWEGSLKIRDPKNGAVVQDIKSTDIGGLGKASMPEWSPDGTLYFVSDRTGWWNLYRWRDNSVEPLFPTEAEFGHDTGAIGFAQFGKTFHAENGHERIAW